MSTSASLARARDAFDRQAWEDAHALLAAADEESALEADDLVRLATAAQMLGRDADAASGWARAHAQFAKADDKISATRCAFWLIAPMLFRGETAQADGWIARTERLLGDPPSESAAHGYLLCATAMRALRRGDVRGAHAKFVDAGRIADRSGDSDLIAQARHGEGRTLIRLGETERGVPLLDEVMAAVAAGLVSPHNVGVIYCSVLDACQEMYDLRRAQEWTDAMAAWCARQPDSLAFRGQCLVHRSELMQLHGAWSGASDEAERARERLMRPPPHRAIGSAYYQIAELQRLRGEHAKAEESYRDASLAGLDPQPGLALLRLAMGQTESARMSIARALEEAREPRARARLLPAFIEIALGSSDIADARVAATELSAFAETRGAHQLRAQAAFAMGAVLLDEEKPKGALDALRDALAAWHELEVPYDAARTRALMLRAFSALGDADSARQELDCARQAFADLGAASDLAALDARAQSPRSGAGGTDLTSRELEVLRLVATGKTNRAIAAKLGISEKTVARHVSNIFTKLGLSSRAAATAYAYERHMLQGSA